MNNLNIDLNYLLSGLSFPSVGNIIMILISAVLIFRAVYHKQSPLLLLPMGVGMLAVNLPLPYITASVIDRTTSIMVEGALSGVYPVLIFFAVGTMIDLGLILADPKNFFIGASSQVGIFAVFLLMGSLGKYTGIDLQTSAATAIIGSADGAMGMYLSALLSPSNFAAITIAAYLYIGFLPVIQPKLIYLLTTEKERRVSMPYLRHVSRGEKIIFSVIAMSICGIFLSNAFPLIGALMFGNILREADIIDILPITIQKAIRDMLTIAVGIAIGSSAYAKTFITLDTFFILSFGFLSFVLSTSMGIITAKVINVLTKGSVNPIIGSAGISAFPVPSWSAHLFAQEVKSSNCLLLHAMAVNTAGIISGAICAGIFLIFFN